MSSLALLLTAALNASDNSNFHHQKKIMMSTIEYLKNIKISKKNRDDSKNENRPGVVMHACNPSFWDGEAGGQQAGN